MKQYRTRRVLTKMAFISVIAGVSALAMTGTAVAAPFSTQASALAVSLQAAGSTLVVDTGRQTATNDGSTATQTASNTPLVSVLGTQSVLTAGLIAQTAVANNNGTAAACSGITGQNGTVAIGSQTSCVTPGSNGVTANLGIAGISALSVTADAIQGTCSSTPRSATGATQLVNAVLNIGGTAIAIPANPAPNTDLIGTLSPVLQALLSPLVVITLNKQTSTGTGQIDVTALSVSALGGLLASIDIGNVTCGPAADLALVPAVPAAGIPVAVGTLAILGGALTVTRRRRAARSTAA